ncbi:hypothetical protein ABZ990_01130 [Streptomyces sp. NPDC046203]|uniref:hypothetical protein n=1 Tax=Streptomyces sp. NPDC046203 TaxID=3154602 RepID=UPI003406125C
MEHHEHREHPTTADATGADTARTGGVRVEVLVVPDCPHQGPAEERAREALADVGLAGRVVTTRVIADEEAAERAGFTGSPTILVDGRDPFAPDGAAKPALTCRLYRTPDGLDGVPDRAALRRALEAALAIRATAARQGSAD